MEINFEECDVSPSFLEILFKIRPEIVKITYTSQYLNAQIMSKLASVTQIVVRSNIWSDMNSWSYYKKNNNH